MPNSFTKSPYVTILTPVYNEEKSLPLFEQAVTEVLLSRSDYNFKVLFIDDGSTDRSWALILDICLRNPRFQGIRLSRNYGPHIALSAGFAQADGDAIATLACDLQDPPEVVLAFLEQWQTGAQIVWGRRRMREDKTWRIFTSNIFANLIRRFAMPPRSKFTTGSFFLIDRHVAACFRQFHEHNRITFALVAWTGFEQAVVDYDRKARVAGISSWNFSKMMKTMYDTFIGFSFLPVKLITLIGLAVFLFSIALSIYLLLTWWIESPALGWTSLMLLPSLFFGVQFLLMGIMGEYLYRIYTEVVRRPLYFISANTDSYQAKDGNIYRETPTDSDQRYR
ncbi:MAG: glycosyltransferase family 2 protein [Chloroflexota bacterium]